MGTRAQQHETDGTHKNGIFVCLDLISLQTGFWESLIMWKDLVSSLSEFTVLAPVTWKLDLFCICHDSQMSV